jgi:hypothetical protein
MMNPAEFIQTLYLGDRACKSITVDGWAEEVRVQVDCISRTRGPVWNFYTAEDLPDGFIVFEGVKKIIWDPNGKIPNDAITMLTVERCTTEETRYTFNIEIASGGANPLGYTPVKIVVFADAIALAPSNNDARIRE